MLPGASPLAPAQSMQLASLYVGDLHPDISEATLIEVFNTVGKVASCRVCRDTATGRSLGYGYVNYHKYADAERALQKLNYMQIKGRTCRIMWSQRDPNRRRDSASNIFVKNLDLTIDSKALHDTFSLFGNILSCKVSVNNKGKSKGYGFVHFEAEESAQLAIEHVNGMMIGSSIVYVGPFIKREKTEPEDTDAYTNLYVKHIPQTWDEATLRKLFSEYGEVTSLLIPDSDVDKRFALVNFKDSDSAHAAVESLHGKDSKPQQGEDEQLVAHQLYVQRAQSRAERQAALQEERIRRRMAAEKEKVDCQEEVVPVATRVCVQNLGEDMTPNRLKELFEPHGNVTNVSLRTNETSGKCHGAGFVDFATAEEAAAAAKKVHLKVVEGTPLYVSVDDQVSKPPKESSGRSRRELGRVRNHHARSGNNAALKAHQILPAPLADVGMAAIMGYRVPGLAPPPFPGLQLPGITMPFGDAAAMAAPLAPAMLGIMAARATLSQTSTSPVLPPYLQSGLPLQNQPPVMAGALPTPLPMPLQQQPPPVLSRKAVEELPAPAQRQHLGERLFALIARLRPDVAAKITGMLLELEMQEILSLLESEDLLRAKVDEAVVVLSRSLMAWPLAAGQSR